VTIYKKKEGNKKGIAGHKNRYGCKDGTLGYIALGPGAFTLNKCVCEREREREKERERARVGERERGGRGGREGGREGETV
jgi:hypothetical protein